MDYVRRSFAAIAVSMILAFGGAAQAQPRADLARARRLFGEGVEHLEAERWSEAAEIFRQVMRVRSTGQVKFNLALAYQGLGQLADAAELLREVADDRGSPDELRGEAREVIEAMESRIGHLTIRVQGDDDRAAVFLDGEEVGLDRIGYPIAVDPGEHQVAMRRGRETLSSREIRVGEGESREITLVPVGPQARVASPEVDPNMGLPEEPNRVAQRQQTNEGEGEVVEQWWFWTAMGLVAVVVVTIVVAVATSP
jgi:hypothetical protein